MKLSNRILALLLSLLMVVSLAGCGLDDSSYIEGSGGYHGESSSISTGNGEESTEQSQTNQSETTSSTTENTTSQTETPSTTVQPTDKPNESAGVGSGAASAVNPSSLPAFSGTAYTIVNGNQPNFSSSERRM